MLRNCLITGASKGLGKFLSKKFFDNGYNLVLVSRSNTDLSDFEAELSIDKTRRVVTIPCDLSSQPDFALLSNIISKNYHIDVLINNAAVHGEIGPFEKFSIPDSWIKSFNVNFFAPVSLVKAVVPGMISRGGGSIINISGGGAATLRSNFSQYASSKAALIKFSETVANELSQYNVRLNCISPGMMATNLLREIVAKGPDLVGKSEYENAAKFLSGDSKQMDLVANLALFLAENRSLGITGKLISANWDNWENWPDFLNELKGDLYTLRRVTARDRGYGWGDNE
jgi:short-subunit dehydrogenase